MVILIAEDDGLTALAVEMALRKEGHDVLGPTGVAEEALRLAEARTPDLALVDIELADGGDGTEIARHLHRRYEIPLLFTSACAERARAHVDVAMGLLRKPYDPELVPRVIAFLTRLAEGEPVDAAPRPLELFDPRRSTASA
ncbi:response regulator [Geminicoccus harenae]|uniref:response regulator n=1 Tax=Geminicoccus harenae TaxID=2498453 RepID=UPI00168ABB5D|nr:response regulator [Geminicoccus harenae]